MNETRKIEALIEGLPNNFPEATEMLRTEIIPLMVGMEKALTMHYVIKISEKTQTTVQIIGELMRETMEEMKAAGNTQDACINNPEIVEAAENFLRDTQAFRKRIDFINELGLIGERKNAGLCLAVADSRLKPEGSDTRTLAQKIEGQQGSGKTEIVGKILELHVEGKTYIRMTDATAKSFYYMGDTLKNKLLFLEEGQDLRADKGFAYAVRLLISSGFLKKTVLENQSGIWCPVEYTANGPISFITTSVHKNLEKQFQDRVFISHPDASKEQTNRIIRGTFSRASGNKRAVDPRITQAWQAAHLMLEPFEVVIPYADKIFQEQALPKSAIRAYERVVSFINAVTIFHQKQRYKDGSGRLVAEMADYAITYQLVYELLLESLNEKHIAEDKKLQIIIAHRVITPRDLAVEAGVSGPAISKWAARQINKDVLIWCDKGGNSFENSAVLDRAKCSGTACLKMAQRPALPSPFEITGNPEWDKGGRLYEIYNLHLDSPAAYIDPADPEPLGVRVLKRNIDKDIKGSIEPEVYDVDVIPGHETSGSDISIY